MESVKLLLIIAICITTVSLVVGICYLVSVLIKINKAAVEVKNAVHKINIVLCSVDKISACGASVIKKLNSPIISSIYLLCCAFFNIDKGKGKK
jgi:hypothetical protein